MAWVKSVYDILKETIREFLADDCLRMAAALAFYTVFSLAPLTVLTIQLVGLVFERDRVQQEIVVQVQTLIGPEAARQTETIVSSAVREYDDEGVLPTLIGVVTLLFGASGAFSQLQGALNKAWNVEPDPKHSGILAFFKKRVLSLGMAVAVAFLLLVSLILSALLAAIGKAVTVQLPITFEQSAVLMIDLLFNLILVTFLFGAMFKVLPDAKLKWRDVGLGAAVTAIIFLIGKMLLGFYIGQSDPGSLFGAAGSLVVLLIWIYGSSIIFLVGAEFTQVWARRLGEPIRPMEGARIRNEG